VTDVESRPVQVFLIRHGATAWSRSGQHTGTTDIPLLADGERDARAVGQLLAGTPFSAVWSSPLQRALQTSQLADLGPAPQTMSDLVEWNYGEYEGLTTPEIRAREPGWTVWRAGAPGGESPEAVSERADRVVRRLEAGGGAIAVFSHGHFLRALAARWVGLSIQWGRALALEPGSVSRLTVERDGPMIASWNVPGTGPR
jgi:broad specificity phosphatase PhoE